MGLHGLLSFCILSASRLFWKVQKVPKVHNSFAFQGQTKISRRSYWILMGHCIFVVRPFLHQYNTSPYYIHIDYRIDVLLYWKLLSTTVQKSSENADVATLIITLLFVNDSLDFNGEWLYSNIIYTVTPGQNFTHTNYKMNALIDLGRAGRGEPILWSGHICVYPCKYTGNQ